MSAAKVNVDKNSWKLEGSSWAGAWKVFAGIGVLGLVGAGAGYATDPKRFAFSWLFAFITVLMVALGAIFFVLIQHLTSAGWSVTVRRTAEFFGYGVLVMIPLFIPVVLSMNLLFPWLGGGHAGEGGADIEKAKHGSIELITPAYAQEHAAPATTDTGKVHGTPPPAHPGEPAGALPGAHGGVPSEAPHGAPGGPAHVGPGAHAAAKGEHHAHGPMGDPHEVIEKDIIRKKAPYLNRTFFLIRVVVYFAIWALLAMRLFGNSVAQDKSKDPKLTLASARFSTYGAALFALSLTFAVFDWVMSLNPTWFSTIFGVVMFSTGVVSSLATIILVTLPLRDAGPLKGAVTVEHYHDLGKLMFGFNCFWAYVGFSQFMLIWYAALPEETQFFHHRWDVAPWNTVSNALILFHFIVPFLFLMSRNFKRNLGRLRIGAALLLVMHVVDIYWFVMPNFHLGQDGFSFHWLDAACLLAVAGIYGAFVFNRMTQHALVPVGDPRLQRSLEFTNA